MDELTSWELMAAVKGWQSANGGEQDVQPPTSEEHDELMAKHG